ncbi:tetratricopeptide repeat protein [Flavobacterium sp.]|uniref:tetratricopeptide repeat protein n=1 Tax=Flavobacterium sp. TaxID=239 RepID=UPI002FDB8729
MKKLTVLVCLFFSFLLQSQEKEKQEKDKILPKANEAFADKKYADAEAQYRISNSKGLSGAKPAYNLGNSIYRQNQFSESKFAYAKAIEKATTKEEKHKAWHNLGNVFMKEKQYSKAVEAYKNALRNNPSDEQTRYNYALAKEYLKNNPEEPNKDKKEDKEDPKKNQDKEPNQKPQNDKEKEDKQDKQDSDSGQKDENKDGKPKPQPSGMSKGSLQNLLEAVNNEEKKIQEKVNAQKVKAKPSPNEKDW